MKDMSGDHYGFRCDECHAIMDKVPQKDWFFDGVAWWHVCDQAAGKTGIGMVFAPSADSAVLDTLEQELPKLRDDLTLHKDGKPFWDFTGDERFGKPIQESINEFKQVRDRVRERLSQTKCIRCKGLDMAQKQMAESEYDSELYRLAARKKKWLANSDCTCPDKQPKVPKRRKTAWELFCEEAHEDAWNDFVDGRPLGSEKEGDR